jgi:flagellar assembly protein FliH
LTKFEALSVQRIDGEHDGIVIKNWVQQEGPKAGGEPGAAGLSARESARLFEVEMQQKREEIERLLKSARSSAQAILSAARDKEQGILREAQQEGFRAGYEAGFAAAEKEAQANEATLKHELQARFEDFLNQMTVQRAQTNEHMEQNILALSVEIAERMVQIELEKNDTVYVELIKEAVQRLNSKERFVIRVNQREYDRFFAEGSGWLERAVQCAPFRIIADAKITPGGCTLESQSGVVKACTKAQLEKVAKALNVYENGNEHDEAL